MNYFYDYYNVTHLGFVQKKSHFFSNYRFFSLQATWFFANFVLGYHQFIIFAVENGSNAAHPLQLNIRY